MATQEMNRQWVTPTRFMIGLGIALVICTVGIFVTPAPAAGIFFGTSLALLTFLLLIGGAMWREKRRRLGRP